MLGQSDAGTLKFAVGEECPYYNKGHTVAILHTNSPNGIEIEGPWNERYIKKNGTSWKLL